MGRFEVTLSSGEKMLVDHSAADIAEIVSELETHRFVVFSEVKGGSSAPQLPVAVATEQITAVRPLTEGSMQGSNFRPKR